MVVMNSPDFVSFSEMSLLRSLTSRQHRPNLLVVCSDPMFEGVLDQLRLVCQPPFHLCQLPGALALPSCGSGTLVLHDVAELTVRQQIALSDWLDRRRGDTQVVSVTQARIGDRIRDGQFLEGLFYRLNTVHVRATRARAF